MAYEKTIEQLNKIRNWKAELTRFRYEQALVPGADIETLRQKKLMQEEARTETKKPDELLEIMRDIQLDSNGFTEIGEYGRLLKSFDLEAESKVLDQTFKEERSVFKKKLDELIKEYSSLEDSALKEVHKILDKQAPKMNEVALKILSLAEDEHYIHESKLRTVDTSYPSYGVSEFLQTVPAPIIYEKDIVLNGMIKHKAKFTKELRTVDGVKKYFVKRLGKEVR